MAEFTRRVDSATRQRVQRLADTLLFKGTVFQKDGQGYFFTGERVDGKKFSGYKIGRDRKEAQATLRDLVERAK